MNVVFFEPVGLWVPHIATALERMQEHIDKGDEVTWLECHASVPACYVNLDHDAYICRRCIGFRTAGFQLLSYPERVRRANFVSLSPEDLQILSAIPKGFGSLAEIRGYRIGKLDIGMAALSTLISMRRDTNPDPNVHAGTLHRLMQTCYMSFASLRAYLAAHKTDAVYLFNGRLEIVRGALRACQEAGVDCFVHERGGTLDRYSMTKNDLPHSLAVLRAEIRAAWAQENEDSRSAIGQRFYEDRAKAKTLSWHSFAASQHYGEMPDSWRDHRRKVVIFNSSEDEFAAIGDEYTNPIYANQAEAIRRIAADLSKSGDISVYLRMHPNMAELADNSVSELLALPADLIEVIPPGSTISTYALMQKADVVISFGSTTGIEAAFWRTPSVLAGRAPFEDLGSVYRPQTHAELIRLVTDRPQPLPIEGALMYGHYMYTFGTRYKHYQPEGVFNGRFRGKRIRPGGWWFRKTSSLAKRSRSLERIFNDYVFQRGMWSRHDA